jgi:hypothetical protein
MDAVVIGDDQTNVSLLAGNAAWEVEARFTSATLNARFYGGEFNCDLVRELTAICDGKIEDTQIATQDGFIIIDMKRDSLGHIEVAAEGRRYSSPETHAQMKFRIDQSYLPAAIANARRIFGSGFRP